MKKIIYLFIYLFTFCCIAQRTSIGVYWGPSIGYNSVYPSEVNQGLFDFTFPSGDSFIDALVMLNDGNLSNNGEFFNGNIFGVKMNFPIVNGLSIQPEIQYQSLSFNHVVYQNGVPIFNDLNTTANGIVNHNSILFPNMGFDKYIIANYQWDLNYLNFPFVLKLYPTDNFFAQIGAQFGFIIVAKESRVLGIFNSEGIYSQYQQFDSDAVAYDFFEENALIENHGFDKDEWPFNWSGSLIFGLGYETKFFYVSARYSVGLFDFFREINSKDNDFFDNYNTDIDTGIYSDFINSDEVVNNNFKLRHFSITLGLHLSN